MNRIMIPQSFRTARRRLGLVEVIMCFCQCISVIVAFQFRSNTPHLFNYIKTIHHVWQGEKNLILSQSRKRYSESPTSVLFISTLQSSSQQQQTQHSSLSLDSEKNISESWLLASSNKTIAEMTYQLLNGTEIGSWDGNDFELMEAIVDSLCAPSTSILQPQQQYRRQYKRTALIIERFLHRIIQEQMMENPYADCVDMTALYTNLIHAWANCNEIGGPERAEEILDYYQTIYEENDSYDPLLCGPTIQSFNAVLGAYAQSGRSDAPQQTIRVLTKLYEWNQLGRTMAFPNQESFSCKYKK
jgi:hypothetical protein